MSVCRETETVNLNRRLSASTIVKPTVWKRKYWGISSYDSRNGWTGIKYTQIFGEYGLEYFTIPLKAGESITVQLIGEFLANVGLSDNDTQKVISQNLVTGKDTYTFVAEADGNYTLYAIAYSETARVKAWRGTIDTPVEGQNSEKLTPSELGKYACEVTFADGTKEMSDIFEVTVLHSCDFTGGWNYNAEKHWKECADADCDKTDAEAGHNYTDGKCECGYEYAYRIKDATYTEVDTSEMGEKLQLWQQFASTDAISDVYNMYEYVNFLCFWPTYTAEFEGGKDYLYPTDALHFIETDGAQYNYGYADGYFEGMIATIKEVNATEFNNLIENITKAQALAEKSSYSSSK